jgi:hypothetical protein
MNKSKTLVAITGHIENETHYTKTLNLIQSLKSEGYTVLYSTHSAKMLDDISNPCDFVIYDSNNLLTNYDEFISNSEHVRQVKNLRYKSQMFLNEHLANKHFRISFAAKHNPAYLILFKRAVQFSLINNFEWVFILNYDVEIPAMGFSSYIGDTITELENSNLKCMIYYPTEHTFMYPDLVLFSPTVIKDVGPFLNVNWESSVSEIIKLWGATVSENIIHNVLYNWFGDTILYKSIETDSIKYWNYPSYHNIAKGFAEMSTLRLVSALFPKKKEDGYDLIFLVKNYHNSTCKIHSIDLENQTTGISVNLINSKDFVSTEWYSNTIDSHFFSNTDTLLLRYKIEYLDGKVDESTQIYDLNYIDDLYDCVLSVVNK